MGEDQSQTGRRRFTVAEASEILGITVEAVRGRIKRGTLDHERTDKGVFVLLDTDQSDDRPRPDIDQTTDRLQSNSAALISAKDETIATLRDQLEAERQAHAEARRLLAAALERIPAVEAPQEASEAAERVEEEPERAESRGRVPELPRRVHSGGGFGPDCSVAELPLIGFLPSSHSRSSPKFAKKVVINTAIE